MTQGCKSSQAAVTGARTKLFCPQSPPFRGKTQGPGCPLWSWQVGWEGCLVSCLLLYIAKAQKDLTKGVTCQEVPLPQILPLLVHRGLLPRQQPSDQPSLLLPTSIHISRKMETGSVEGGETMEGTLNHRSNKGKWGILS